MLMKCGSKSVDVTCLMNRIRDNAAVTCLSAQFFIFELFLLPISYVLKTISLNMFFFFFFLNIAFLELGISIYGLFPIDLWQPYEELLALMILIII